MENNDCKFKINFRRLFVIICLVFISIFSNNKSFGQTHDSIKTYRLQEVEVYDKMPLKTHNTEQISLQYYISTDILNRKKEESVSNLLKQVQGIDIRQRGQFSTQTDISFRGGNFDQTAVYLNGINFTDPQTGHYSLNIPVSSNIISGIEVFKNTSQCLFGSPSFSGIINILTEPDSVSNLSLSTTIGMYGLLKSGIELNLLSKNTSHLLYFDYERSDGYVENTDFKNFNAFYYGNYLTKIGKFESQLAFLSRDYGANGFYSLRFPNQHDSIQTVIASVKYINKAKVKIIPSLYYRYQQDCYQLIKGQAREKNNFHQSQMAGINLLSYFYSIVGKTAFTADYKIENIYSTGLGLLLNEPVSIKREDNIFYKYAYTRQYYGLGLNQSYTNKWVDVNLAFNLMNNTDNKNIFYYLPSLNFAYKIPCNLGEKYKLEQNIYVLAGKNMRMPTFTDLFYHTGDILGNDKLKPEEALTFELGYNYNVINNKSKKNILDGQICVFQRYGKNMIDYIKAENDSLWRCVNHTKVNTTGIEVSTGFYPQEIFNPSFFITNINVSYAYIIADKPADNFLSRYVLDYLQHKVSFNLTHKVISNLLVNYSVTFKSREGKYLNKDRNYENYPNYTLLDLGIQYKYRNWDFHLNINNVFNVPYFDIGGLTQPGFWIMGGVKYKINLKK